MVIVQMTVRYRTKNYVYLRSYVQKKNNKAYHLVPFRINWVIRRVVHVRGHHTLRPDG